MNVTPETIAVALGRTAPDAESAELAQWEMWISDALMLIEARLGDPGKLDQGRLDYVVREAVVSHIRKPDDATQVEVAVDNTRASRTYSSSKGRVTIIDEWWNLLSPKSTGSTAFSIRPGGGHSLHSPWCSLMFRGDTCSCGVDIAGRPIYETDEIT